MSYLKNTDVALRIGLNPFNWIWLPKFAHDGPTSLSPKRHTFVLVWLFLQLFVDIDDGTMDIKAYTDEMIRMNQEEMDAYEEPDELDAALSKISKRDQYLV